MQKKTKQNNKWLMSIVVFVALAGAIGIISTLAKDRKNDNSQQVSNELTSTTYPTIKACDAFTLEDAKQILGANAKAGVNKPGSSTDHVVVSNCTYTNGAAAATVVVRSATDTDGAFSNSAPFYSMKPEGVEDVPGLGEAAYYDPQTGQLHMLENGSWVMLNCSGSAPHSNSLENVKKMANLLIEDV